MESNYQLTPCRACLNHSSAAQMNSLYSKIPSRDITYVEMFVECTSINIFDNDGFPEFICQQCAERLEFTYDFKLLCRLSDTKLRESALATNDQQVLEIKQEFKHVDEFFEIKLEYVEQGDSNTESNLNEDVGDDPDYNENTDQASEDDTSTDSDNSDTCPKSIKGKYPVSVLMLRDCEYCFEEFKTLPQLCRHLKHTHGKETIYRCLTCKKNFKTHGSFYEHMKSYHQDLNDFKKLDIVTDPFEQKWRCCTTSFPSHAELYGHVQRVHKIDLFYKCSICSETFSNLVKLQKHMKVMKHNYENHTKAHLCWMCGKSFKCRVDLETHLRIHSGEKPYSCNDCEKTFSCRRNLQFHKLVHKTVNKTCDICGKFITTYTKYKQHMSEHTKKKKHKCLVCEKMLMTKEKLQIHMVSHTGVRKYECDVCNKLFKDRKHLKVHYKIHTGEKDKVCQICGAAFIQQTSLKWHMKKHDK